MLLVAGREGEGDEEEREGLDIGTRWTTPGSSTPTYKAMKMYRNYDGNKSTFGDTSVSATGPNPDNVSAFAALRSTDGALTVMAINKQLGVSAPVNLMLTNFFAAGMAQIRHQNCSKVGTKVTTEDKTFDR